MCSSDLKRWSFTLQLEFLIRRVEHHELIHKVPKSCIQDRTLYEDPEIFAKYLHGLGNMTDQELEQALDPVAQREGVVSTLRESSWRGLWLAKSLTELHGGAFTVRSAPSAGTTVTIGFPSERCIAAPAELAQAAD